MIKKIIIGFFFMSITFSVNAQERNVYTDAQIGFDREKEIRILKADDISEEALELTLSSIRASYVTVYELATNRQAPEIIIRDTTVGCGDNIGFEQNFINWCYTRFKRDYNPTNPGTGNDVPVTMVGAQTCDNLATSNVAVLNPLPLQSAAPNLLDLSSFTNNVVRLGEYGSASNFIERVEKTIQVTNENRLFSYRYAVVLQDPGHQDYQQPYFRVYLQDSDGNEIPCSRFEATAGLNASNQGFEGTGTLYKQPAIQTIDLINQGVNVGEEVTIIAEIADCTQGGHYGVAYFEGFCSQDLDGAIDITNNDIRVENDFCLLDNDVVFSSAIEYSGRPRWNLYNNKTGELLQTFYTAEPSYVFTDFGSYRIELVISSASGDGDSCAIQSTFDKIFTIVSCFCEDCYSFKPIPGDQYVLSAWVKNDVVNEVKTYTHSGIMITYLDKNLAEISRTYFIPEDRIIEGWQRIYKEFTIPVNAVSIELLLVNISKVPVYFDDIRVHPYNGNMKSYVYDGDTQRLMAELDENNYSTFYEYDPEGGLVRVKKETEKGVYTIEETRSKTSSKN